MPKGFWGCRFFLFTFVFLIAWSTGCGKENPYRYSGLQNPTNQQNPVGQAPAVTLALFGAPWCSNCKVEFPQIQNLISQLAEPKFKRLALVLYVTTGATAQEQPTDDIAQRYKAVLNLSGTALADEWRWKKFRQYVGGGLVLPGAAVLDANGNVIKAFRAGAGTFIPSEIVKTAEEAIE
jgi:thiol-disulfide isomerase/thioredoxin